MRWEGLSQPPVSQFHSLPVSCNQASKNSPAADQKKNNQSPSFWCEKIPSVPDMPGNLSRPHNIYQSPASNQKHNHQESNI